MAKVPTYVAQRGIEAGSAHQVNIDMAPFRRIEQLGGAISSFGADLASAQKRNAAKEDGKQKFAAQQQYNLMQQRLNNDLDEQKSAIPDDGSGFHDKFLEHARTQRDTFLSSITDPDLREQFAMISEVDVAGYDGKAAQAERDHGVKFYGEAIAGETDNLVQQIDADPDNFGDYVQQGSNLIASAPLIPPLEKAKMDREWRTTAALTYAGRLMEQSPGDAISALGFGAPEDRYDYLARSIQKHVETAESGGDPFAVSPKGAIGLMQVMPDTAKEIAREIGDPNYPTTGLADEQRYLSRPDVSKKYGTYYLTKQLNRYGGDIEAALIAYNAGPGNADKWIEAGRDYGALPKRSETEPYAKGILAKMGSGNSIMPDDGTIYDDATFRSEYFTTKDFKSKDGASLRVKKSVVDFADALAEQTGLQFKIISGHRSEGRNADAGGAKSSRHTHGDAIDVDISGMGPEQRAALLTTALQMGVRGVGLYPGNTSMHLDLRPDTPRAWYGVGEGSYSTIRERGAGVSWETRLEKTIAMYPEWAREPMRQYYREDGPPMQPGTFNPTASNVDPRLAILSPSKRRSLASSAETRLNEQAAALKREESGVKFELANRVNDDIAQIEATGKETNINEVEVATILGEKSLAEWQRGRDKARLYYNATQDLAQLNDFELDARVEQDLKPKAGTRGYADQVVVQERVHGEVEKLRQARIKDPASSVSLIPEVKRAWDAYVAKSPEDRTSADMMAYIDASRRAQTLIGISEEGQNLVPRQWAQNIANSITLAGQKGENPNSYIRKIMGGLEEKFGDYADEVFMEAMTEVVKDEELTPLAASILKKMAAGTELGAADRNAADMLAENAAANEATGWGSWAWDFAFGDKIINPGGILDYLPGGGKSGSATAKTTVEPSQVPQQAIDILRERWGEPAVKEYFKQQYGDEAFEAARRSIEGK